ncbi:MAG: HDOD domain-containing protein [Burkholderiales bacterium]
MQTQPAKGINKVDTDRELDRALASGPLKDIVIPPCPELLMALRVEMDQADPDPQTVADIAGRDVAMAASLIRTANSPYYARSRPVTSVGEALGLLGMRMTEKLLTAFLMRNSIKVSSPLLEHFWETSTRRALGMAHIARQLYGVDAELAYTCGLFCHVGIPILMQGVRGYAGTLTEALARQDRSFTETENAAHKTDHAVVGALVARTWRLPTPIYQAVRMHHDFTILQDTHAIPEVRTLVAMALVAEHLVALHEGAKAQREWVASGAACLAHLSVEEAEVDVWVDALHPVFESVTLA